MAAPARTTGSYTLSLVLHAALAALCLIVPARALRIGGAPAHEARLRVELQAAAAPRLTAGPAEPQLATSPEPPALPEPADLVDDPSPLTVPAGTTFPAPPPTPDLTWQGPERAPTPAPAQAAPAPVPPDPAPPARAPAPDPAPAAVPPGEPLAPAQVLERVEPHYPARCLRRGHGGTAVVRVRVGLDGRAHDPQLVRSAGCPELDQAALAAVAGYRFSPATRGGVPAETSEELAFRFQPQ